MKQLPHAPVAVRDQRSHRRRSCRTLRTRHTVGGAALPQCNSVRVRAAVALALLVVAAVITTAGSPTLAANQPQPQPQAPDAGGQNAEAGELDAPLVAPSHGYRAHALVEQWVRRGEVPDADGEAEQQTAERIRVTGLLGVQVTLRLDGMTVGRSEAYRADPGEALAFAGEPVDVVELLGPATRRALAAVEGRLRDAHRRALERQIGDELPEPPRLADVTGRLLVDVQLAHRLEPVEIAPDAELTAVLAAFAPGYHGLYSPAPGAAGQSDGTIWPATALAHASSPRGQLMRLLDAHGRDPEATLELGRPGGIPLYRFEVVHVVRAQPHLPPRHLVRGSEPLPTHAIDSATLDDVINRLGTHLAGRFTSRHMVRGTYHPTSNRYDPDVAETRDAGLASWALMRYAQRRAARAGTDDEDAQTLAHAAREAAAQLGRTLLAEDRAQRPAGLALALLTLVDDLAPGEHVELRDELADALLAMYDADADVFEVSGDGGDTDRVGEASTALIVAALAAVYEQTRDDAVGRAVAAQLDALGATLEQSSRTNVAALPWLIEAHRRAGRLLAQDAAAVERLERREQALDRLTDRLLEHQITRAPTLGPTDVVGGFELVAGPRGAPPSPDWRTAHVVSHLALVLREPGITDELDLRDRVLRAALGARFLAQLMMDETSCYYARSLPEAVGGVRSAPWDNRLSVAGTAMALLACVQLQETIERHVEP